MVQNKQKLFPIIQRECWMGIIHRDGDTGIQSPPPPGRWGVLGESVVALMVSYRLSSYLLSCGNQAPQASSAISHMAFRALPPESYSATTEREVNVIYWYFRLIALTVSPLSKDAAVQAGWLPVSGLHAATGAQKDQHREQKGCYYFQGKHLGKFEEL